MRIINWNVPKNGWISWNCMKVAWNCVKIAWNCVRECVKVCESIIIEFLSLRTCIFIPNMLKLAKNGWNTQIASYCMKLCQGVHESVWKYHHWISQLEYMHFDTQYVEIGPKMAEIAQIAWKLREIAWTRVWNFLKVLPMNFSARVHAFWYPTCRNWPKNG